MSLFLGIGKTALEKGQVSLPIKVAVGMWLLSALFSFLVLFPRHYPYSRESTESIKEAHKRGSTGTGVALFS